MNHYTDQFLALIQEFWTYIISTAVGVIGKISYEIGMKRKMSLLQWFAIVGISIFTGYIVSVICVRYQLDEQAGFLVPIATLLGEKILIYVTNNYREIFGRILGVFIDKKSK